MTFVIIYYFWLIINLTPTPKYHRPQLAVKKIVATLRWTSGDKFTPWLQSNFTGRHLWCGVYYIPNHIYSVKRW